VLEAVFLSVLGALVGGLGALGIVRLLTRVPTVNGVIVGRIQPIFVVYGFVIAVVLGLFGSIIPMILATQLLPTEALRHECSRRRRSPGSEPPFAWIPPSLALSYGQGTQEARRVRGPGLSNGAPSGLKTTAPKGRNWPAQGNALGTNRDEGSPCDHRSSKPG